MSDSSAAIDAGDAIAAAFVAARRSGRSLPAYPGERPGDLAQAYRIQDRAIALDGREILGWKVGRINPPEDARLGTNRLAGPIFAGTAVEAARGEVPDMPVFGTGFAAGEAELLLHVAAGHRGAAPRDDAATKALIDEVRLGIEVASSPYPGINTDGPCVTASDFGNNAGLVLGAPLDSWRDIDLCAIPVRSLIDGAEVGAATAATMLDGPYGAVRFLLANLDARGIDYSRGLWVSSGAITGVHQVAPGQTFTAIFGDYGRLECRLTDMAER
ncbi:MAG: 2-keto-4-pentenoate hydratase [Novosphingobium sp.]